MIVYRDVIRRIDTLAAVARLRHLVRPETVTEFLVEAGEFEQGVLDALHDRRDAWDDTAALLRGLSLAAGTAFVALSPGRGEANSAEQAPPEIAARIDPARRPGPGAAAAWQRQALDFLDRLAGADLPPSLLVKAPEGYAHYGLDPAAYADAAHRYVRDVGAAAARRALVVGVRTIGTSLSAVVPAVCGTERSVTVRPRGSTGARHIRADGSLMTRMRSLLDGAGDVLVVDEGPDATGETVECVTAWLRSIGVPPDRIVLMVSADSAMPLAPEPRRNWFRQTRKFLPPHSDDRPATIAARLGLSTPEALGAGRWRTVVRGAASFPACVGFERAKYRARDSAGRYWQIRYAGLGRWLEELCARADRLAAAGLGMPVRAASAGFIVAPWVDGRPLHRGCAPDRALLRSLERYLVGRAGRFPTGEPVWIGLFLEMLLENAAAALGPDSPALTVWARRLEALPCREAVIPDARLRPFEWLRTPHGYVKVDALDHGDGFRFPGPTDAAWDLAGAAVEFELDPATLHLLVRRCARAGGESWRELAAAVEAYMPVYAACSYGEAELSSREATSSGDRRRLLAEAAVYARSLVAQAARAGSVPCDVA